MIHGTWTRKEWNRLRKALFCLAAVVILAISFFSARKGTEEYQSDAYGTTSDGSLSIADGQEVRAQFTLHENGFAGIYVKFVSRIQSFGEDALRFSLIDDETDELICETTLSLKEVLPQINTFVPLPYETSKDKDITVLITGEDISSVPSLYTSKGYDNTSSLFVGNAKRSGEYLVLSAVYRITQSWNIQSILKGAVYLFLLLLIYLWPVVQRKAEHTRKKEMKAAGSTLSLHKHRSFRLAVGFFALSVVYTGLAWFVFRNNVIPVMDQKITEEVVAAEDGTDDLPVITISSNQDVLTQSFIASEDHLSSLTFLVQGSQAVHDARIHLQVMDGNENLSYLDTFIKVDELTQEKAPWHVLLEKEVTSSRNKEVRILITPELFEDQSLVTFYAGKAENLSYTTLSGQKIGIFPCLTVGYADYDFLKTLFIIFASLVFGFLILSYCLLVVKRWSIEQCFVPIALYLGILYLLIIPVYSVPDEYTHIDTAYAVSNRILGIEKPAELPGYDYKRTVDIENDEYLTYYTTIDDYRRLYLQTFDRGASNELEICSMRSALANANVLYYLPAGIGLTIGRLFRLGTLPMLLLGRLCNLLFYVCMFWVIIRRIPFLQRTVALYATLPIYLQQAASFSYDCVLNVMALLFISECLRIAYSEEKPGLMNGAILLFSAIQIVMVKGGVYIPLFFLLFAIPIARKWNWKKCLVYVFAVGLCGAMAFAQLNLINILRSYFSVSSTHVNPFTGSDMYTLGYLLQHPFIFVSLYINTVFSQGSRLIYEFFGGKMGSITDIQMPWVYSLFFAGSVAYTFLADHRGKKQKSSLAAVGYLIVFLLSVVLTWLSMLLADTSMKLKYIAGLQGRYFFPVAILLFVGFGRLCPQKNKRQMTSFGKLANWMIHIFFLMNIIMVVFPNI